MGLLGGIARTAVIAGTATAVSNRVSRRQAQRWAARDARYAAPYPAGYAQAQYAPDDDDLAAQLDRLTALHHSGHLSDDEFAAAKAKLLGP